jgi:hypothetical protein
MAGWGGGGAGVLLVWFPGLCLRRVCSCHVAEACLAELDALSAAVAAALQQPKPAGGAGAATPSGGTRSQHKWNVLPPSLSTKASRWEELLLLPRACSAWEALLGLHAAASSCCAALPKRCGPCCSM